MTTTETESRPAHRAETPRLAGVPDGLQPEDLDRLVAKQADVYQEFETSDNRADFDAFLKAHIDEELRARGFNPDAEDEQSREDYNFARGIYETVMSANKAEWLGVPEGQTLNRRELVADAVAEWYEPRLIESRYKGRHRAADETSAESSVEDAKTDEPAASESSDESTTGNDSTDETTVSAGSLLSSETLDAIHAEKDQILDEYAQKVAKRSRSIVESAKTGAAIEAAGSELGDLLSGIASEMYADLEAQGVEEHMIVRTIDRFIAKATEDTLAKVEQYRLAEYNNSRPYAQKLYDKWADWSNEKGWFSKGKLKKAAVFAVPGAALGFALAPLVGAVGAGVLTGAVAMTGSRSIGRHLANGFMKKRDKRFAEAQTEEMRAELDAIYEQNGVRNTETTSDRIIPRPAERNLDLIEFVNQRSHDYRVRNRNRVLAGTAIAMSVGLLSSTAAEVLNGSIEIHNPFGGHDTNPGVGNTPATSVPPGQVKMPGETLLPKDHLDWNDFGRDARFVEPGEGGFQTLKEMGIPENKWEAIWQDAGAKLHEQGKTYTMDDGRWGWDRTMRLSDRDLNVIARAAERNGVALS